MGKVIDGFENMNKRTKLILSLVGVSAVVVPALLLLVLSKNTGQEPQVATSKRTVDAQNIEKSAKATPLLQAVPTPSPKAGTASAEPKQGTGSAE